MVKPFLCLLVIFAGCVGARERRRSLIPSCQKLLEKLTEPQQSSLRDIVQVINGCMAQIHYDNVPLNGESGANLVLNFHEGSCNR